MNNNLKSILHVFISQETHLQVCMCMFASDHTIGHFVDEND